MALFVTYFSSFLSFVGFTSARLLLSLYALSLGASPFDVGVIAALFWLFPMLLSWPIGRASDRFGSRWLLTAGGVAGVCSLLLPGLFHGLPVAYLAAALGGLSLSVYNVVSQNVVGMISGPEKRTRNFANFTIFASSAGFVGPLLTGFCIDHAGYASAGLIMAGAPLLGLVTILLRGGLLPRGHGEKRSGSSLTGMLAGRGMRSALVIGAVVTLGTDMFQFYLPVYGHQLGLSASAIGAVTAVLAVAMFGARVVMQALIRRMGEERLLMSMLFLGSVAYLLVPLVKSAVALAAVSALFGLAMGCGQPLTVMLAFSLSEAGRAGETLGIRLTVNNLVRVVGPMVFGSMAGALGMLPMFWLNAALLGGGGMLSRARANAQPHQ